MQFIYLIKKGKKMQSEPFMPSLQEILENKNAISIIRVEYDPIWKLSILVKSRAVGPKGFNVRHY